MIIKIPFKTPTVNHLYGQRGYRKFLTKEAKDLRLHIETIVSEYLAEHSTGIPIGEKPLKVVVYIYEDWYCQNGSVKRVDIDNRAKFLLDSVFNALGINDKYIFSLTMIKGKPMSVNECAIIEITPI